MLNSNSYYVLPSEELIIGFDEGDERREGVSIRPSTSAMYG